jgi:hypothetical protein
MSSDAAKRFHALLEALPVSETPPPIEEARAASDDWAIATTEPEGVRYEAVDASGVQYISEPASQRPKYSSDRSSRFGRSGG